ncbi:hypothetical protein QTG54_001778 [Skeletonema marinoi]|uniref:Calcineurin-like phosphoesterase domain-containing protein n=1 Tax=Skeletonema marinoi TaxID=267567 RepID=A0AAD8YM90_9STRA|nr:hypothetical protein QTG54_001778 [Skeletonema marinoi]
MRAALQHHFINFRIRYFNNRKSCRYIHSSSITLSSTQSKNNEAAFPSAITFLTDVEGDGHYFDRFIHHSEILGFRSIQPSFGACKKGNWNFGSHDPKYFPYDKEVVFLDDGTIDNKNSMLVYGGDIWDKGGADFYVIRQLLSLHTRYPSRVHFIMGNRDINKLRIVDELDFDETKRLPKHKGVYWLRGTGLPGDPEKSLDSSTMTETAAERLKWMLRGTMGSVDAFELRRQELQRERLAVMNSQSAFSTQECLEHETTSEEFIVSDDDVAKSYLHSCNPNLGLMSQYLSHAKLMIRFGSVIFLHGALPTIEANSFPLPWINPESDKSGGHETLTEWIDDLNDFASDQITNWKEFGKAKQPRDAQEDFWASKGGYSNTSSGGKLFGNLLQYGMNTLPDKSKNQSVVYNSWMRDGMPRKDLFSLDEQSWLENLFAKEGLQLILSGHQPVGDAPWPIQLSNNNWILPCDTSFSGDVCWTSAEKASLGRGSRPNGRGEVAVSETLIMCCQRTGKLKSVKIHGFLSDGSHYEINNLLDVDDKHIGRPLLKKLPYTDNTKEATITDFWVKAKLRQQYLLSAGKGFHVWNSLLDHNGLKGV